MADIVHEPFIGETYDDGIQGRKIAIVGYSHYYDHATQDTDDFTERCIRNVISGEWKLRFFDMIRNAFGFTDHVALWNSVMFFNYVPTMIGTREQKFAKLDRKLEEDANARFIRLLEAKKPDLAFVFTKKTALGLLPLQFKNLDAPLSDFKFARLSHNDGSTNIYRLRHTQGTVGVDLRAAISLAMATAP